MRRLLSLLVVLLTVTGLAASGSSSAGADPSSAPGGDQAKRDDIAHRREQINGQLDLLKASDTELQTELNRLAGLVKAQEAELEQAKVNLANVEHQLGGLGASVDQARHDAEAARHRAQERAINAYMHPGIDDMAAMIEATDYDQAHRRRTLIGEVAKYDSEVLQGSFDAQHQLEARQQQLTEAQQRADQLKREAQTDLDDIAAARDRQVQAKQALDQRIAGFTDEADALAAEQANLTRIINERATPAPTTPPSNAGGGDETAAPPPTAGKAPAATTPTPVAPTTAQSTTTRAPTRPTGVRLSWPVSGTITSPFGPRWGKMHDGIDIGVNLGTPIHAAAAGTIIFCGQMSGYGNVDLVDHHNGMVTLYAHQNQLACTMGQSVSTGQVIGYAGNTGHSTGPHLHFEVRINSVPVDPLQYLP